MAKTRAIVTCHKCHTTRPAGLGGFGACPVCFPAKACVNCGVLFVTCKEQRKSCYTCCKEARPSWRVISPDFPDSFWESKEEGAARREELRAHLEKY